MDQSRHCCGGEVLCLDCYVKEQKEGKPWDMSTKFEIPRLLWERLKIWK